MCYDIFMNEELVYPSAVTILIRNMTYMISNVLKESFHKTKNHKAEFSKGRFHWDKHSKCQIIRLAEKLIR